jgi:DNA-directed RNA polymerase subunit beta'
MMQPLEANQGKAEYNPVWLMLNSGARGNKEQVRQLLGLR